MLLKNSKSRPDFKTGRPFGVDDSVGRELRGLLYETGLEDEAFDLGNIGFDELRVIGEADVFHLVPLVEGNLGPADLERLGEEDGVAGSEDVAVGVYGLGGFVEHGLEIGNIGGDDTGI